MNFLADMEGFLAERLLSPFDSDSLGRAPVLGIILSIKVSICDDGAECGLALISGKETAAQRLNCCRSPDGFMCE